MPLITSRIIRREFVFGGRLLIDALLEKHRIFLRRTARIGGDDAGVDSSNDRHGHLNAEIKNHQKVMKKAITPRITKAPAIFTMGSVCRLISSRTGSSFGLDNGETMVMATMTAATTRNASST